jgi:uncharacterized protein YprB with RNaseH-like and TPR domain
MLTRTFLHLPKVGYLTERRLWAEGLESWEDVLAADRPPRGFSARRFAEAQRVLETSRRSLERREHRFFAEALAPCDHWRALSDFSDRRAFLDIETTGLGAGARVTVIGLYDGKRVRTYVAGDNLDSFCEDLDQFSLIVTFNGASFDVPFLCRCLAGMPRDFLHVDLRYPLKRLGLSGGLKSIERRLGLARAGDLADLSGEDAVRLWHEYLAGNEASLELLVRYNAADVENLETLVDWAYPRLWAQTWGAAEEGAERG